MDSSSISHFTAVTGATADIAQQYLQLANGDLNTAISSYLASHDSNTSPSHPLIPSTLPSTNKPDLSSSTTRTGPRIATLNSSKSNDSDKNTYYAGGEKSGVAVQGDPKSNQPLSAVEEILKLAAENRPRPEASSDQEDEWDEDDGNHTNKVNSFSGHGFRLGTEEESASTGSASNITTPPSSAQEAPTKPKKAVRTLNFWVDGFSIDDGSLYPFSDPQSKTLLEALKSGRAPLHVLNVQHGQPVDLKVVHRPDEKYKPPPSKPFSGQGNRLGTIIPGHLTSSSASNPVLPVPSTSSTSNVQLTVDPSLPVTTLQIRLADGTRMVAKFNTNHTVGQLRAIVNAARSDNTGRTFSLSTIFPMRILENDSLTLEEAGLLYSVVVQKNL